MKQNHLLFSAVTALAFLASCSSDNVVADASQEADASIKFNTSMGNMTRGTTLYDQSTNNITQFWVHAFKSDGSIYFTDNATNSGSGWSLAGGNQKWPSDGSDVTFFAYTPQLTSPSFTSTSGSVDVTQTDNPENQEDLLTAYAKQGYNATQGNSSVTLKFKHAFAKIIVKAKNESSDANDYRIEVKGVKLRKIENSGKLTFQTTAEGSPTWTPGTNKQNYVIGGGEPGATDYSVSLTKGDAASDIMNRNAFLVIPQTVSPWASSTIASDDTSISIYCKITQGDAGTKIFPTSSSGVDYAWLAVPFNTTTTWKAGNSYIYTIRFFANGTGGAGQGDPDDINAGGGSVIQDVNIGFTTEIGDWEPGNNTGESIPSES